MRINYQNSGEAFNDLLSTIACHGEIVSPNGNETKEITGVSFNISNPRERFIIEKERKANPIALLAETLWVLSGRNDMEFIKHYLPRAPDFSDDGLTWRAGYGKRIRRYTGQRAFSHSENTGCIVCDSPGTIIVDQLEYVFDELTRDSTSRRALINIWDVANDHGDSKDIPCNVAIQFLLRKRMHLIHVDTTMEYKPTLEMVIFQRSQDIMWGFLINMFEWSVLHELLAKWLDAEVGKLHYTIGSLHLYKRHYRRATRLLESADEAGRFDIYEGGYVPFDVDMRRSSFDETLADAFDWESYWREGNLGSPMNFQDPSISNGFILLTLAALQLYNAWKVGKASTKQIHELIEVIPENSDVRIAVEEYFHRQGLYNQFEYVL